MNLPQIQAIMQEFEKQNEMMGMKEEMMEDAMDDGKCEESASASGGHSVSQRQVKRACESE